MSNYDFPRSERKRARLVCALCHDRKVKCDIESRSKEGSKIAQTASRRVVNAGILRTSKRGRRLRHRQQQPNSSLSRTHLNNTHNFLRSAGMHDLELLRPRFSEPATAFDRCDDPIQVIGDSLTQSDPVPSISGLAHRNPIPFAQASPSADTASWSRILDTPTSGTLQNTSPMGRPATQQKAYLGETEFLQVYDPETRPNHEDDLNPPTGTTMVQDEDLDLPPPDLQQSFSETFFEYCFSWCPILEKNTVDLELARSPLLCNALAVSASHIRPPMLKHAEIVTYYNRAKTIFYDQKEPDMLTSIQAIMLFYWWSPRMPTIVNTDSTWWWTGIAIRQAQQMGLHRESRHAQSGEPRAQQALRRRIWWTLFARERLTAVSQGRPVIIQRDDCNTLPPSLEDFSEPNIQAEVFIHWVQVCGILGDVGTHLLRAVDIPSLQFPIHLAEQLIRWVGKLPEDLDPGISTDRTRNFHRDVHQLHLHYLTTIILLNLKPTSNTLPDTYQASAMAATCIARIMKGCLSRSALRYLPAITSWCCGMASLALLHVRRLDDLRKSADEDLKVLKIALTELATMWTSANIFLNGLERLWEVNVASIPGDISQPRADAIQNEHAPQLSGLEDDRLRNSINWIDYFPFASMQTSPMAATLLRGQPKAVSGPVDWPLGVSFDMHDLFDPFQTWTELPRFE